MRRLRDQLSSLVYKQPGFIEVIRALTALSLLCVLPQELLVVFKAYPYHVPAWRVGQNFLSFPEPLPLVSIAVWGLYCLACLALLAGFRKRIIPVYLFSVWFYYQSLDRYIFHSSFMTLLSIYLLAIAVDRRPRSLSRLLIQIALSSYYIFSALHQLHPEFLSGLTLYDMLGRGFLLRPEVLPAIYWLSLPHWITDFLPYAIIASELFIGIGLWFRPTRFGAMFCGIMLHSLFAILIPGFEFLALVACAGYLAFFDNRSDQKIPLPDLSFKKPFADKLVVMLASLACIILPARFFFLHPFVYLHMSLHDRSPWGFATLLFHEDIKYVEADYRTPDKYWHKVELAGRMKTASSASDLIVLSYFIARTHPEADRIMVANCLLVNSHAMKMRKYTYFPAERKFIAKESISDGIRIHH